MFFFLFLFLFLFFFLLGPPPPVGVGVGVGVETLGVERWEGPTRKVAIQHLWLDPRGFSSCSYAVSAYAFVLMWSYLPVPSSRPSWFDPRGLLSCSNAISSRRSSAVHQNKSSTFSQPLQLQYCRLCPGVHAILNLPVRYNPHVGSLESGWSTMVPG